MFAEKTIWYTTPPPRAKDGSYQKHAVFDKRVKVIRPGQDIEKTVGSTVPGEVMKRMKDDGHIATKRNEEAATASDAEHIRAQEEKAAQKKSSAGKASDS